MRRNEEKSTRSLEFVQEAAQGYEFEVQASTLLPGGFINENYRVTTESGDKLLRVYPLSRAVKQIKFEHALQEHLRIRGCCVPFAIADSASLLVRKLAGSPLVWMQCLDAVPLTQDQAFELPARELCKLLHPVFEHLPSFEPPFRPTRETRVFARGMATLLTSLEAVGESSLARRLEQVYSDLETWERENPLPTGAIHADIHAGNVLRSRQDEGLWLIDFDDAHVGSRALDWVLTAMEFSINHEGVVDESRYNSLLHTLSDPFSCQVERDAAPRLREILTLKFAVSFAVLGKVPHENHYLQMLLRS